MTVHEFNTMNVHHFLNLNNSHLLTKSNFGIVHYCLSGPLNYPHFFICGGRDRFYQKRKILRTNGADKIVKMVGC